MADYHDGESFLLEGSGCCHNPSKTEKSAVSSTRLLGHDFTALCSLHEEFTSSQPIVCNVEFSGYSTR